MCNSCYNRPNGEMESTGVGTPGVATRLHYANYLANSQAVNEIRCHPA